jgi:hypothetical protein
MTLTKIIASISEVIFNKTRMMYIFVVRSIMTNVSTIWHTFKDKKTDIEEKLTILQNRCLSTIAKVFRVTFVSILETKIFVISINIHLNELQTQTRLRLRIESTAKFITDSCRIIVNKLREGVKRRRKHRIISSELKTIWAKKRLTINALFSKNLVFASWLNLFRITSERDKFIKQQMNEIKKYHVKQWINK